MALVDYVELVDLVRELISGTGREVTFGKLSSSSSDGAKPWKPTGLTASSVTAFATFVPVGSAQDLGLMITDEELSRRATSVCLVAPHATEDLQTYNTVVDGGTKWRIVWIRALKPGDVTLLLSMGVAQ